jgi:DeoR family fructose operon transcriptional repressor
MWKNERRQRISRIISDLGKITTDQLVADLSVSRETVRRDLLDMEGLGQVKRVHGGAVAPDDHAEPPLSVRQNLHVNEKIAIAKLACCLITHHKVVFFDAGSTTIHLAQQLAGLHDLHVITNSIHAAQSLHALSQGAASVTLLGGSLTPFGYATAGGQTIREIGRITADLAFLSPAAVDPAKGALSDVEAEADIAAAMRANSRENVILADTSKFTAHGHFQYCEYPQIDVLVTDSKIRAINGLEQDLRAKVGKLIIA